MEITPREQRLAEMLEDACGIIANVAGGNWEMEAPEWRSAAAKWRDEWHAWLAENFLAYCSATAHRYAQRREEVYTNRPIPPGHRQEHNG